MFDDATKNCSKCPHVDEDCSREQIRACLKGSECTQCDSGSHHQPYGRDESRHCRLCGAEWSVWK